MQWQTGCAQQKPAARDKHAHKLRPCPGDNLYRDPTGNVHEWHMCDTVLRECRERQTKAGASDIQVQVRLTLNITLLHGSARCGFVWRAGWNLLLPRRTSRYASTQDHCSA